MKKKNALKQELREIPINQIKVTGNYRKSFDEKSLNELAQSIRENGVIEPLVVRPKGKGFAVVAGERRWRAATIAGLATLPCVVRDLSDTDLARLRDELSLDVAGRCKIVGKSDAWVYQVLTRWTRWPA